MPAISFDLSYFLTLWSLCCLATLAFLTVLAKLAPALGLLDIPGGRKQHDAPVPVVGGLAVYLTLMSVSLVWWVTKASVYPQFAMPALVFVGCCTFMVVTGVLDDRYNLSVFPRIASEFLVAAVGTALLELKITQLGNLLGTGDIQLAAGIAYPFTVIAFFGVINAFNMLDGLDGQVAALTLCSLVGLWFITDTKPSLLSVVIFAATLAFLLSNLGFVKGLPKTFLGDAGSKLLGFLMVVSLVSVTTTRHSPQTLQPVSALFVIAIPLYDMVFVSLRRMAQVKSPLSADRGHLHHLLQGFGLTSGRALGVALCMHGFFNLLGYALNAANVSHSAQFGLFLGGFAVYCVVCQRSWWYHLERQQNR